MINEREIIISDLSRYINYLFSIADIVFTKDIASFIKDDDKVKELAENIKYTIEKFNSSYKECIDVLDTLYLGNYLIQRMRMIKDSIIIKVLWVIYYYKTDCIMIRDKRGVSFAAHSYYNLEPKDFLLLKPVLEAHLELFKYLSSILNRETINSILDI